MAILLDIWGTNYWKSRFEYHEISDNDHENFRERPRKFPRTTTKFSENHHEKFREHQQESDFFALATAIFCFSNGTFFVLATAFFCFSKSVLIEKWRRFFEKMVVCFFSVPQQNGVFFEKKAEFFSLKKRRSFFF